jgi:osmotically-inducible protein OsmY
MGEEAMRFHMKGAAGLLCFALLAGPAAAPAGARPRVSIRQKLSPADQQRVIRVREAVQKVLTPSKISSGAAASKDVGGFDVTQRSGTLYLTGTVSSQAQKDAAGQAAVEAAGGRPVLNRLTVK